MTLIIIDLIVTLSIKNIEHNNTHHVHFVMLSNIMLSIAFFYCYAECRYAEWYVF
jgi:hypothetical protein